MEAGERTVLIDKERQVFVDKFAEERNRREEEEEKLRKRLQVSFYVSEKLFTFS